MHKLAMIAAVFALSAAPAFADSINLPAGPYKLDAAGKCHGAKGRFVKSSLCKPAQTHTYKMDQKGKCHDEKGKFAPMSACVKR
jgi:hypothetical protein